MVQIKRNTIELLENGQISSRHCRLSRLGEDDHFSVNGKYFQKLNLGQLLKRRRPSSFRRLKRLLKRLQFHDVHTEHFLLQYNRGQDDCSYSGSPNLVQSFLSDGGLGFENISSSLFSSNGCSFEGQRPLENIFNKGHLNDIVLCNETFESFLLLKFYLKTHSFFCYVGHSNLVQIFFPIDQSLPLSPSVFPNAVNLNMYNTFHDDVSSKSNLSSMHCAVPGCQVNILNISLWRISSFLRRGILTSLELHHPETFDELASWHRSIFGDEESYTTISNMSVCSFHFDEGVETIDRPLFPTKFLMSPYMSLLSEVEQNKFSVKKRQSSNLQDQRPKHTTHNKYIQKYKSVHPNMNKQNYLVSKPFQNIVLKNNHDMLCNISPPSLSQHRVKFSFTRLKAIYLKRRSSSLLVKLGHGGVYTWRSTSLRHTKHFKSTLGLANFVAWRTKINKGLCTPDTSSNQCNSFPRVDKIKDETEMHRIIDKLYPADLFEQFSHRFKCSECATIVASNNTLTKNNKNSCKTLSYTSTSLFQHMRTLHHTFLCLYCHQVFQSLEILTRHLQIHHPNVQSPSPFYFSSYDSLKTILGGEEVEMPNLFCLRCDGHVGPTSAPDPIVSHDRVCSFKRIGGGRGGNRRVSKTNRVNVNDISNEKKNFSCHLCSRQFIHSNQLEMHLALNWCSQSDSSESNIKIDLLDASQNYLVLTGKPLNESGNTDTSKDNESLTSSLRVKTEFSPCNPHHLVNLRQPVRIDSLGECKVLSSNKNLSDKQLAMLKNISLGGGSTVNLVESAIVFPNQPVCDAYVEKLSLRLKGASSAETSPNSSMSVFTLQSPSSINNIIVLKNQIPSNVSTSKSSDIPPDVDVKHHDDLCDRKSPVHSSSIKTPLRDSNDKENHAPHAVDEVADAPPVDEERSSSSEVTLLQSGKQPQQSQVKKLSRSGRVKVLKRKVKRADAAEPTPGKPKANEMLPKVGYEDIQTCIKLSGEEKKSNATTTVPKCNVSLTRLSQRDYETALLNVDVPSNDTKKIFDVQPKKFMEKVESKAQKRLRLALEIEQCLYRLKDAVIHFQSTCKVCFHSRYVAVDSLYMFYHMKVSHENVSEKFLHSETIQHCMRRTTEFLKLDHPSSSNSGGSGSSVGRKKKAATVSVSRSSVKEILFRYIESADTDFSGIYSCCYCTDEGEFKSYSSLLDHLNSQHPMSTSSNGIHTCQICHNHFLNYGSYTYHICFGPPGLKQSILDECSSGEAAHSPALSVNYADTSPVKSTGGARFRCRFCGKQDITTFLDFQTHLRKSHVICDICLTVSGDQESLMRHCSHHPQELMCMRCFLTYEDRHSFRKHLHYKHQLESKTCRQCHQQTWPHVYHFCPNWNAPNKPIKVESNQPFSIMEDGFELTQFHFVCEVCDKDFGLKGLKKYRVHMRIHTGVKPYLCSGGGRGDVHGGVCGMAFISQTLLWKHQVKVHPATHMHIFRSLAERRGQRRMVKYGAKTLHSLWLAEFSVATILNSVFDQLSEVWSKSQCEDKKEEEVKDVSPTENLQQDQHTTIDNETHNQPIDTTVPIPIDTDTDKHLEVTDNEFDEVVEKTKDQTSKISKKEEHESQQLINGRHESKRDGEPPQTETESPPDALEEALASILDTSDGVNVGSLSKPTEQSGLSSPANNNHSSIQRHHHQQRRTIPLLVNADHTTSASNTVNGGLRRKSALIHRPGAGIGVMKMISASTAASGHHLKVMSTNARLHLPINESVSVIHTPSPPKKCMKTLTPTTQRSDEPTSAPQKAGRRNGELGKWELNLSEESSSGKSDWSGGSSAYDTDDESGGSNSGSSSSTSSTSSSTHPKQSKSNKTVTQKSLLKRRRLPSLSSPTKQDRRKAFVPSSVALKDHDYCYRAYQIARIQNTSPFKIPTIPQRWSTQSSFKPNSSTSFSSKNINHGIRYKGGNALHPHSSSLKTLIPQSRTTNGGVNNPSTPQPALSCSEDDDTADMDKILNKVALGASLEMAAAATTVDDIGSPLHKMEDGSSKSSSRRKKKKKNRKRARINSTTSTNTSSTSSSSASSDEGERRDVRKSKSNVRISASSEKKTNLESGVHLSLAGSSLFPTSSNDSLTTPITSYHKPGGSASAVSAGTARPVFSSSEEEGDERKSISSVGKSKKGFPSISRLRIKPVVKPSSSPSSAPDSTKLAKNVNEGPLSDADSVLNSSSDLDTDFEADKLLADMKQIILKPPPSSSPRSSNLLSSDQNAFFGSTPRAASTTYDDSPRSAIGGRLLKPSIRAMEARRASLGASSATGTVSSPSTHNNSLSLHTSKSPPLVGASFLNQDSSKFMVSSSSTHNEPTQQNGSVSPKKVKLRIKLHPNFSSSSKDSTHVIKPSGSSDTVESLKRKKSSIHTSTNERKQRQSSNFGNGSTTTGTASKRLKVALPLPKPPSFRKKNNSSIKKTDMMVAGSKKLKAKTKKFVINDDESRSGGESDENARNETSSDSEGDEGSSSSTSSLSSSSSDSSSEESSPADSEGEKKEKRVETAPGGSESSSSFLDSDSLDDGIFSSTSKPKAQLHSQKKNKVENFSIIQSNNEQSNKVATKLKLKVTLPSVPTPQSTDDTINSNGNINKLYCICQTQFNHMDADMIGCDGPNCRYEWFHFRCVDIVVPPDDKWFCPDCQEG